MFNFQKGRKQNLEQRFFHLQGCKLFIDLGLCIFERAQQAPCPNSMGQHSWEWTVAEKQTNKNLPANDSIILFMPLSHCFLSIICREWIKSSTIRLWTHSHTGWQHCRLGLNPLHNSIRTLIFQDLLNYFESLNYRQRKRNLSDFLVHSTYGPKALGQDEIRSSEAGASSVSPRCTWTMFHCFSQAVSREQMQQPTWPGTYMECWHGKRKLYPLHHNASSLPHLLPLS